MNRENFLERQKMGSILFYVFLLVVAALLPLTSAHATSIGTNVSVTGTLTVTDTSTFTGAATFNGNVTIGNLATADTLTVTARLAADLDPSANNTYDLGSYDLSFKDIYASSTVFAADISDLLYVNATNSRIGISTSTPSAKLSIGTANTTSTLDVPQLCFRTTSDAGGTDSEVYYWPCVGSACPNALAAASGWVTSTVSCF